MSGPAATAAPEAGKVRYLGPLVLKIVLDLVVPTAGYYGLRAVGLGQVLALCLTSLPAVGYVLYRVWRGQRVDTFEVLLLLIIAATDVTSFLDDSPRLSLSTDGVTSWLLALGCVWSLRTRRPFVYHLVRSLLDNTPLRVRHRTDQWDAMWERDPSFRRPWIVSTVVWAIVNGVFGVVRLSVAFTAPVDLAPLVLGVLTVLLIVGMQIWQTTYLRHCFRAAGAFVSMAPLDPSQERAGLPPALGGAGVRTA